MNLSMSEFSQYPVEWKGRAESIEYGVATISRLL